MLKSKDIRIRDPFILREDDTKTYFLYGTTDENVWEGKGAGFDVYQSRDLIDWEGPFPAFRPAETFWADHHFWAPEVHFYKEKYYMFATFKATGKCRGTQILVAQDPLGPFKPLTTEPITPRDWECLDGTLFTDDKGDPWMVFCHEWLQVQDGEMCAIPLARDLKSATGDPVVLFSASEANWTIPMDEVNYVTDGPYLYRNKKGELLMLWSSKGEKGYAIGVSRAVSGKIFGPWMHDSETLFDKDGGHGMVFETFEGQLMLVIHEPNDTPNERPAFFSLEEISGDLVMKVENSGN